MTPTWAAYSGILPSMPSASSLHEHAVQAEAHLEQLATGLAKAGADEGTIQAVSQMADVTRKIVTALGKGQEATGDEEPAAPPPEREPQRHTMDSAAAGLHQDMQASAAKRQQY